MKQSFLRKVTGGVLLLLAGLTQAVMAQQAQTDPLIITEDVDYADEVRVKELIIKGASEDPTDIIDISLRNNSAIETITVKSGKAKIHFTRDENVTYTLGTISIAKEAELTLSGSPQKLSTQSVNNEGQFSDETGNEGMILGPAGLWIQGITPNADITAPDGTQIKSVSLRYAIKSFYKKVIVETYQEGQWVNYDEIKGGESENENPKLRSTQGNDTEKWTLHSSHTFATAIKGTYRFRIETTKDQCKTIWYSKPYELIASEYEIKDDQLTMGEENSTTILPSLLITAGKEGEEVKEATLENIEIAEHAVGTPSVKIESNAKVNLTLKGTNNLGSIELGKGSTITLKPETAGKDMNEKLSISSVRNGGSFTDETATVSLVKDLENHTMIEFTDTVIYQIDNAISVSLRAVGNSLDGDYLLWGEHTIEKLNSGKWEAVQSKSRLRADTPAENPNRSAEVVINLTTTETGTYRMKVTSTDIEDEAHNATLYFLFEITTLKDKIIVKIIDETTVSIDGTSEEYKNANMLLFASDGNTESPIKVTLNNVRLKEVEGYEEYTSSVVAAKQNYELTLNGDNDLAAFTIEEGATATLKKGDSFKSLNATVYNGGKFIDETGTIQQVVDLDGLNMLSITGYEMTDWNGYSLVAYSDFFFGDYEVSDSELEHLVNGEWKPYHNSVMRSAEGTPEGGASDSHECAYTYTGLEAGQYRIRVYAEKWTEGAEFGEANHAVTLYHHFTITEPEPEPTYYSITLPSVEGATTSPAAGTYWEIEGSSFSFSLTLDPDYDQSQPIVKANGTEVTPDANGTYTVSSIYEDITITIEGITENTPTGNAEVEENDVKVWAADGQLHLSVPSTERVWIYAFNGNLIRSLDEVAGDITVNLNKGSYIIVVGEKRYKVAL
ncbi:MAG: hypothetical protein ACLSGQ_05750 [Parabacteroides distasonis]|uniref:hypothetical protein n=1 Tax=Parabacteroides sp. CH2-D42-20 TaxID=2320086 RepID=UPI000EF6A606|nr:hypothetical protein [Parabacteroides sp. CH2-D42-20]RLT69036.1 hypothetical protein D7V92_13070 [Parabacteroides sp. CH2-D42-20]